MALTLNIVTASTRPGRIGPKVADWIVARARSRNDFDVHSVDLAKFGLPVYDEPNHPRMQKYQHQHTRAWSRSVDAADAFVFVTPEYNFGPTPALANALNFLYNEWTYKPAAFVSYGGISGGMRGVEAAKGLLTTLKMVPVVEGVVIPSVFERLGKTGFEAAEILRKSADAMLDELHRWATALRPMRVADAEPERKAG